HRLRDGTIIKRFPGLTDVTDAKIRQGLRETVVDLQRLRGSYDELCQAGEIRQCGCGKDDCPVHTLSPRAWRTMDYMRRDILDKFRTIYPAFEVQMWR